jgi:hypothetical protein
VQTKEIEQLGEGLYARDEEEQRLVTPESAMRSGAEAQKRAHRNRAEQQPPGQAGTKHRRVGQYLLGTAPWVMGGRVPRGFGHTRRLVRGDLAKDGRLSHRLGEPPPGRIEEPGLGQIGRV